MRHLASPHAQYYPGMSGKSIGRGRGQEWLLLCGQIAGDVGQAAWIAPDRSIHLHGDSPGVEEGTRVFCAVDAAAADEQLREAQALPTSAIEEVQTRNEAIQRAKYLRQLTGYPTS